MVISISSVCFLLIGRRRANDVAWDKVFIFPLSEMAKHRGQQDVGMALLQLEPSCVVSDGAASTHR
ncbi:hypothetical protein [Streptomyces albogriseolus]|uniref:hypothetical protein n=1 Tax=Streptomyces albogriseolus TaxID=1887 RepID=UPI00345FD55E